MSRLVRYLAYAWLLLAAWPAACAPVLLISLDGLRPDYVTAAGAHATKLPNLRRFMEQGNYAEGVIGVAPTLTYPSHTTIITGVAPSRHGILANTTFDPLLKNQAGWYWYGQDVRVTTLWEAASEAGIVTASVNWPVTVAARGVRYLIPEYWRAGTAEDVKLIEALSRPDGWLQALERKLGPWVTSEETTVAGDETRTRYAIEMLKTIRPGLLTLHLSALDETEHQTSPFSQESWATLEALDGMVGRLMAAALEQQPDTVVVVVSDHGFVRTDHKVNLLTAFADNGLIKFGKSRPYPGGPTVESWEAWPWPAGALAAVMLRDPADAKTKARVEAMLHKLAANPENGIDRVLDAAEARKFECFPDAAFLVELKPGYQLGFALSGDLITPAPSTGMHGYLPDRPEMRASFFALGKGIAPHHPLGVIDMRQIAPTLAALLGVRLEAAERPKLDLSRP